jgi:glycerophosphoryl diester phosphodiesterase
VRLGTAFAVTVALLARGIQPASAQPQEVTRPASSPAKNPFRSARTLIIPHAGGDGLYPDNTLLAYEATMAAGANVIDIDVRASKDGVLIAFHDATLDRTTDGIGRVAETRFERLRQFDAGWGFKRGRVHPFRGKGARIPTLEMILRRFPTELASIELKDHNADLIGPVCTLLRSLRRANDVVVGSNDDGQLLAFRAACPEVRTSATMTEMDKTTKAPPTKPVAKKQYLATVTQLPYGARFGTKYVSKESIASLHHSDVAVLAWVVNDPQDMKLLIDWGVDGIYTQRPDRLAAILNRGPV